MLLAHFVGEMLDAMAARAQTNTRGDRGTDRRRKQYRYALRLALVPSREQALGIHKHMGIGRAPRLAASASALALRFTSILRRSASILRRLKPLITSRL
jgi:predicted protein tyrosine phosphatase